jgi:hypothetical protein
MLQLSATPPTVGDDLAADQLEDLGRVHGDDVVDVVGRHQGVLGRGRLGRQAQRHGERQAAENAYQFSHFAFLLSVVPETRRVTLSRGGASLWVLIFVACPRRLS